MKSKLLAAVCLAMVILACNKENSVVTPIPQKNSKHSAYRLPTGFGEGETSRFISMDTANRMIASYLNSISFSTNDSDVRSFSVNADSLRAYLADASITNIKLVFAHTMNYINAGNENTYAGYQAGAITIVIAGYDASGNYVYHGGSQVLDHVMPCPYTCPSGSAAHLLLE